ncbi:GntR family transcriptional regulator [Roseiarcus fermentans]|uniref:GntR family transcriptional regulator n=1 Tax=Roseiarcus fermentans TaxID=1473586 RepID=A0A366F9M7_9HYPH|nr:GntR family transcriptional regulator [Roseiarcus fermentans]RBP11364.1 GntR family transcriptional regulator [Roseiarcus fermentans]
MDSNTRPKKSLPLVRIDFQSMHDKVYEQITKVLMRGGFEPGQKVSSRKLAAALGTSDMPVRAALGRLLAEGGLVQNPNGTFSVPLISKRKFREVMELRALLEGRATAEACGRIDEPGFGELRECAAGLRSAIERNDIHEYLDFNQRLKFTIYRYSPSRTLLTHIELLWLQSGPFLRHLNTDLNQMTKANFHDEAIAALERNESAEAAAAISRDILAGMAFLLERAEFAGDEPQTGDDAAAGDEP